jgi:hypothetical protein
MHARLPRAAPEAVPFELPLTIEPFMVPTPKKLRRNNPSCVARADVSGEVGCYGLHGLHLPNVAYPEKIKAIPTDA